MMNDTQLNDLIGSRICHDLISPLGAIGNGVELLSMTDTGAAPELALISESIESANARIRFFRVAFGAAPHNSKIGNTEIKSILRDIHRGSRLKVDWLVDGELPRGEVKLAFLIILCIEAALPWGGSITVTRKDDERWCLTASGERQKVEQDLWALLKNPDAGAQVTASEVHFALVYPTAMRLSRRAGTDFTSQTITVSF